MPDAGVELPPTEPPTDDDRRRVIEVLRAAGARLGLEEAERRMDAAVGAATKAELALLVWDLPEAVSASPADVARPRISALRSAAFRTHATAYGLVNGMLVGVWALTDVHRLFWPFFPIAGGASGSG